MIPMLFMGEEWGSKAPFPFFCDFKGGLADAVRKGRRQEYGWAYAKYGDDVPDPLEPETFRAAVLDWETCTAPVGERRLALVRQLLVLRKKEIVPRLSRATFDQAKADNNGLLTASWRMGDGAELRLLANLSSTEITRDAGGKTGALIWGDEVGKVLPPWSVFWRIGG
jgi:maltooligosyltrehalose trehalohydrolase